VGGTIGHAVDRHACHFARSELLTFAGFPCLRPHGDRFQQGDLSTGHEDRLWEAPPVSSTADGRQWPLDRRQRMGESAVDTKEAAN